MTINIPIVKINDSAKNGNGLSDSTPKSEQKGPSFRGALEIKGEKTIGVVRYLGDDFSSAQQRLVSGITGMMTQPFFDLNNKDVDEKTRIVSCSRNMGKIIAGTTTGVLIRMACVAATKRFTQNENTEAELVRKNKKKASDVIKNFTKTQQLLLPEKFKNANFRKINKYRGAVGTFAAVIIMIATNFFVDAPLTTYMTNKFVKLFTGHDPKKSENKKAQGGR